AVLLLFWTLLPIYNIILISLQSNDLIFSGNIFPVEPTIQSYITVVMQDQFYVEAFWIQLWNSLIVGVATALITLAIASLATFSIARLKLRFGWMLSTAALLTYLIPATFLVIP